MNFAFRRAGCAALVVAAAVASAAILPAQADEGGADRGRADQGRIIAVQSDLQKRADALLKGITEGGGKAKYGAIEPGASKEGLVIKDAEITSPDNKTVKIERVEVRDFDWENPNQPARMDLSIKKLVIPASSLEKDVADLGVTSLTINADFAYKLDDAKKTFEVSGIAIDIVELGELKLQLKLAGIASGDLKGVLGGDKDAKRGDAKPGEDAATKLLAQLMIVGASISFKDKSLVERLIRADAKKKNISEAEAKRKMLDDLAEQKKEATDDATRELFDAATKFLTNPGTIELAANPGSPVNVMAAFLAMMGSPGAIKQMLGIALTVR